MYFSAASNISGTELWQTGITSNKTSKVTDINNTSTSSSIPSYLNKQNTFNGNNYGMALNNTLYYIAAKPETGYELYKSDGTEPGTDLAKDFATGEFSSQPQLFLNKNNAVYFVTTEPGYNIYKIDSTGLVTKIASLQNGIASYDVADNGLIFYISFDVVKQNYTLWRTDGTANGTFMLTDKLRSNNSENFVRTVGNKAYFTAYTNETGIELWVSNGKVAGTKMVKDIQEGNISSSPFSLYPYKNYIVFGASSYNSSSFYSLWKSDGTKNGTVKIKEIIPYGSNGPQQNYNDFFCIINDTLFLNASDANGTGLWKTNGTENGTVLVKNFTGSNSFNPSFLTNVNGTLFFTALDNQLWKSNGTESGTALIKTIPYSGYNVFTERCTADGKFFFNTNKLLWVSDGTDAGTHIISEKRLQDVSNINNLNASGNTVFFTGYSYKYGTELYAGDAIKVTPFVPVKKNKAEAQSSFTAVIVQNPVTNYLKLQVQSTVAQTIKITVANERGNIIKQQQYSLNKGNSSLSINCMNWQSGMYIVNLAGTKGETISLNALK